ncbi:uncharacterized protein HD556DRAFT_1536627 [Suillus plorans]|uniref:Uncharacterized protein n=1 Tax=Suillus plorans TaxID=116603 RepID=A0A9P7DHP8_9AGAM|nr:uncharacterized protein HD556DRAFT_1536627 [Suillus plorans]KAG1793145.1 hypothetical protein HD556DRAFT_1536627 [Suillus plorans]
MNDHISQQSWLRPPEPQEARACCCDYPRSTIPAHIAIFFTAPITFKAHNYRRGGMLTHHTAPPSVAELPFAKTQERTVAAGDPGLEKDLVPDEYFDQDPVSNQQFSSIAGQTTNSGEHGIARRVLARFK